MVRIETITLNLNKLGRKRKLRIYLPNAYANQEQSFGVLYMHDGCNLFNDNEATYGTAWQVANTLEALVSKALAMPIIIVGIDNSEYRWDEYSPWTFSGIPNFKGYDVEGRGGKGEAYAQDLIEIIKPYIDNNYRTKPDRLNTGIASSSMGGLISIYIGMKYSNTFAYIGAFSTATRFAEQELLAFIKNTNVLNQYYYLDAGTHEAINGDNPYYNGLVKMYDTLLAKDIKETNIKPIVAFNHQHNEAAWAQRFPDFLTWINTKL